MKSDGQLTYFAPDIAYHGDKVNRGFDQLIDILGADHGGYVKRMKAAVSALSGGNVPLDIKLMQLVKLFKNGEPFKMSKRAGNFVTLRDLVEQVGADVTRFVMLTRKTMRRLILTLTRCSNNPAKTQFTMCNMLTHAGCSAMRRAADLGIDISDAALTMTDLTSVQHDSEIAVVKKVAEWPRLVEIAARTNEPHRIAFYLYELASDLHSLWNKGKRNSQFALFARGR